MTQYIIRQMVSTVKRNDLVDVITIGPDYERDARSEYARVEKEYPHDYFELIKIEHEETCLAFTPFQKDDPVKAGGRNSHA